MKIHRIQIKNFRNFRDLDVFLGNQVVIAGENKIGKTNLLYALRLILDPSLSETARQLHISDFWDGLDEPLSRENIIEISIEFSEFDDSEDLIAVLGEHLICPEPMIARLTYVYKPILELEGEPKSDADYESYIFGGERVENRIGYDVRSRIPIEFLHALRNAERDLATWTQSPLRPLLDEATRELDRDELAKIADRVLNATEAVLDIPSRPDNQVHVDGSEEKEVNEDHVPVIKKPIRELSKKISSKLKDMVGSSQALDTTLGFSPTDPDRLLRAIRMFIDGGKRSLSDASLGSANLLYLTLKSLQIDQLALSGTRDHTILAIEEPEAHLHPHLQRLVYRDFLQMRHHQEERGEETTHPRYQSLILTTHSPHILSVTPLRSIVLLRRSPEHESTIGASAVGIELSKNEEEDIERYLDVNRGEILFAQGVILVEGSAEEYLVPIMGRLLNHDFDELGISVCSVSGINFLPYVKILGKKGFDIPFAVVTDLDPQSDGSNLGHSRVLRLLKEMMNSEEFASLNEDQLIACAPNRGIFLNSYTLEIELVKNGCAEIVFDTLAETTENNAVRERVLQWKSELSTFDEEQFLTDITAIGKGRFAQRLAGNLENQCCPPYIEGAITYVAGKCR